RRALGDQTQRLLRTAQRRGYLLDVTASTVAEGASLAATVAAAAAPLPLPTANRPMLVVLPFENLGDDPEQHYLASGVTADLVTDLTHFEELQIVSPPALASSSAAIPKEASYIVAGNVRRAEGRIRIHDPTRRRAHRHQPMGRALRPVAWRFDGVAGRTGREPASASRHPGR